MAATHVVQRELPVTGRVLKSGERVDASAFQNLGALIGLGYLRALSAQELQQEDPKPIKSTTQAGKAA